MCCVLCEYLLQHKDRSVLSLSSVASLYMAIGWFIISFRKASSHVEFTIFRSSIRVTFITLNPEFHEENLNKLYRLNNIIAGKGGLHYGNQGDRTALAGAACYSKLKCKQLFLTENPMWKMECSCRI